MLKIASNENVGLGFHGVFQNPIIRLLFLNDVDLFFRRYDPRIIFQEADDLRNLFGFEANLGP